MDITNGKTEEQVREMMKAVIKDEFDGSLAAFARDNGLSRSFIASIIQDGKPISARAAATVGMEPVKLFTRLTCHLCGRIDIYQDANTCTGCDVKRDALSNVSV